MPTGAPLGVYRCCLVRTRVHAPRTPTHSPVARRTGVFWGVARDGQWVSLAALRLQFQGS